MIEADVSAVDLPVVEVAVPSIIWEETVAQYAAALGQKPQPPLPAQAVSFQLTGYELRLVRVEGIEELTQEDFLKKPLSLFYNAKNREEAEKVFEAFCDIPGNTIETDFGPILVYPVGNSHTRHPKLMHLGSIKLPTVAPTSKAADAPSEPTEPAPARTNDGSESSYSEDDSSEAGGLQQVRGQELLGRQILGVIHMPD